MLGLLLMLAPMLSMPPVFAQNIVTPSAGLAAPPDVSTDPILKDLPRAETTLNVAVGKFGKPSIGDEVILNVTPLAGLGEGAVPQIAEKLKAGPVEHGAGRILWWKDAAAGGGKIQVGLTSYVKGKFEIAPIVFVKDGAPVFASQSQAVELNSVGGEKEKDDIYPPEAVSFPQWVWIVAALLALALVLAALYFAAKWYKKRSTSIEALAKAPRLLSPLEEFEKVRGETEQKGHVDKGTFKPHYFALSDAAKRFLGKSFRFDAEERTTRELVRELESLGLSNDLVDKWEALFNEMDITKFTDQVPVRELARGLGGRLAQLASLSYRVSPVGRDELMKAQQAASKPGGVR